MRPLKFLDTQRGCHLSGDLRVRQLVETGGLDTDALTMTASTALDTPHPYIGHLRDAWAHVVTLDTQVTNEAPRSAVVGVSTLGLGPSEIFMEPFAPTQGRDQRDAEFAFTTHFTMGRPALAGPACGSQRTHPGNLLPRRSSDSEHESGREAHLGALRGWLSPWSYDDARGDAMTYGPGIAVPAPAVGYLADGACTPSHTRREDRRIVPDWLMRPDGGVAR